MRQILARQDGPTLVAGHSYGGQIITALGTDAPNAVGLVYVAGFGLDEGESIGALLEQAPAGSSPALAHLDVDADKDPAQGSSTMLFQPKLVFEGVDDRLDPLAHPTQRPEPIRLILAVWADQQGPQGTNVI